MNIESHSIHDQEHIQQNATVKKKQSLLSEVLVNGLMKNINDKVCNKLDDEAQSELAGIVSQKVKQQQGGILISAIPGVEQAVSFDNPPLQGHLIGNETKNRVSLPPNRRLPTSSKSKSDMFQDEVTDDIEDFEEDFENLLKDEDISDVDEEVLCEDTLNDLSNTTQKNEKSPRKKKDSYLEDFEALLKENSDPTEDSDNNHICDIEADFDALVENENVVIDVGRKNTIHQDIQVESRNVNIEDNNDVTEVHNDDNNTNIEEEVKEEEHENDSTNNSCDSIQIGSKKDEASSWNNCDKIEESVISEELNGNIVDEKEEECSGEPCIDNIVKSEESILDGSIQADEKNDDNSTLFPIIDGEHSSGNHVESDIDVQIHQKGPILENGNKNEMENNFEEGMELNDEVTYDSSAELERNNCGKLVIVPTMDIPDRASLDLEIMQDTREAELLIQLKHLNARVEAQDTLLAELKEENTVLKMQNQNLIDSLNKVSGTKTTLFRKPSKEFQSLDPQDLDDSADKKKLFLLEQELEDQKEVNKQLKAYVGDVLINIIVQNPDILEKKSKQ